jgi:hypothetical protein
LNKNRLERVKVDSDFDTIRSLREYQLLLFGMNPEPKKIFVFKSPWTAPAPGVYPVNDNITFDNDNNVTHIIDNVYQEYEEFQDMEIKRSFTGKYKIIGAKIYIYADDNDKVINGEINNKANKAWDASGA